MRTASHSFRLRVAVPGVVLRIVLLLLVTAASFALVPVTFWRVIAIVAVVVGIVLPGTLATWAAIPVFVIGLLLGEPDPGRTAIAVLVLPLVHTLGGLVLHIPPRSRVQLRVLALVLRRFLLVQLISQPLALVVGLLPRVSGVGFAWLAPVGGLLLVAVAIIALRAFREPPGGARDADVRGRS